MGNTEICITKSTHASFVGYNPTVETLIAKKSMKDAHLVIESAIARVRAHPDARIPLKEAAAQAGVSPVRFHQLFKQSHGENYGAFVRRVRLEYAVGLMRAFPERSCTTIAFDAGFSESSDFARSFKRTFGIAPSQWDRLTSLARISCTNKSGCHEHTPPSLYPDLPTQSKYPVVIRDIKAVRVAVLHVPMAHCPEQLAKGFDQLESWLAERDELKDGRHFIGLSADSDLDTPVETYRFELAYEVGPNVVPSEDVLVRTLPACRAAVLPCRGGEREFVTAWDYLQRVFLPQSDWAPALAPQMEIYFADPRKARMTYWDMDCVMPVKNKGDSNV